MLHKLIERFSPALVKTHRLVLVTPSFILMQRRGDIPGAAALSLQRDDGCERQVTRRCGAIAGEEHRSKHQPFQWHDLQVAAYVGELPPLGLRA
jgi:hypothetical protein